MKKVAICLSGHLRGFDKCYNNFLEMIVNPLESRGYQLYYFVSTWNVDGYRSEGWMDKININNSLDVIQVLQPSTIIIENFDRYHFIDKFNSDKWQNYSHLSNHTTCGDACSMYYKLQGCMDSIERIQNLYSFTFDAVIRTRPDLLLESPINFPESMFEDNTVYMPRWHGKYKEINNECVDYFAVGNYNVMKKYLSIYNNLDSLIIDCSIHTGEGFLDYTLKEIPIKRLDTGFSIQRFNHIEKII